MHLQHQIVEDAVRSVSVSFQNAPSTPKRICGPTHDLPESLCRPRLCLCFGPEAMHPGLLLDRCSANHRPVAYGHALTSRRPDVKTFSPPSSSISTVPSVGIAITSKMTSLKALNEGMSGAISGACHRSPSKATKGDSPAPS